MGRAQPANLRKHVGIPTFPGGRGFFDREDMLEYWWGEGVLPGIVPKLLDLLDLLAFQCFFASFTDLWIYGNLWNLMVLY